MKPCGKVPPCGGMFLPFMQKEYGAAGEWKLYSKKAGWSYVVKSGKRTLVYLIPQEGAFEAAFVFGQAAVDAAQNAPLPARVIQEINEARVYMEGRSVQVEIWEKADVGTVKRC